MYKKLIILLSLGLSFLSSAQNKDYPPIPPHQNSKDKEFKHNESQAIAATDKLARKYLLQEIKKNNDHISDIQVEEMLISFFKNAEKKVKKYKNTDRNLMWLVSYIVTASRLEITINDKALHLISIYDIPIHE